MVNELPSPATLGIDPGQVPRARYTRNGVFGVLDIGTTKVVCLIGRADGPDALRVIGFGWQRGRGVRNGGIADIDEAERAIRAAVGQAEDMADLRLRSVLVNLSCGQPESRTFGVQWPVGGRAVTDSDVRRVVGEARTRAQTEGRDVIHALPLGFQLDTLEGVEDPRGLCCETLTARLHIVDAQSSALRNLGATVARCDLDLAELVSAPVASSLSVLVDDERELGAIVIDMGGGTTSIAVVADGHVLHTAQLPVGGLHVTNDIAHGLSTTLGAAERLKTLYGNVDSSPDDEGELLPVPLMGEEDHNFQRVPRSLLVSIVKPRLEETFELVRDRLEGVGLSRMKGARVVLTGGASQLVGVPNMAGRILDRHVRLGRPTNVRGLPEHAQTPPFATAAGLLAWAAGDGRPLYDIHRGNESGHGLIRRLVAYLRDRV